MTNETKIHLQKVLKCSPFVISWHKNIKLALFRQVSVLFLLVIKDIFFKKKRPFFFLFSTFGFRVLVTTLFLLLFRAKQKFYFIFTLLS